MSPIMALHASRDCCRHSIRKHGLLPAQPMRGRPYGVYVFRDDGAFDHLGWNSRTVWEHHPKLDLWECAYIGPLCIDQYVLNAMVFLDTVEHVTLVVPPSGAQAGNS
jgi:hypothetical protein